MIYENIVKTCKEKGISIMALERKAGIANGVIGRWRESSPTVDTLRKVADALEVPITDLIQ